MILERQDDEVFDSGMYLLKADPTPGVIWGFRQSYIADASLTLAGSFIIFR